jgi:flagellar L-ring protein precursor FlgH
MNKLLPSTIIVLFILTGCSSSVEKINKTIKVNESPQYQIPKQIIPPQKQAKGSLFTNGTNSLFADRKSLQLGDIIFVTINEGTTGESRVTETGSTLKQEQIENTRTVTPLTITADEDAPGLLNSIVDGIGSILGLSLSTGDSTSAFETESTSESVDQLVNDIATVATQAYQNGNYFIKGEKNIIIKGQKVTVKLSGVLNPHDLNKNSEVSSNRLANLKVMLYKTGTEADLDEKPWGTQIIDAISPF